MTAEDEASQREQRLEQVLAEYLRSVEQGRSLDRQELIDQHPDLADDLRSFFRNRDAMEQLAEPVQEQAPTIGLEAAETESGGNRVRYFGDYELVEEIARGGMGVVYRARQVSLNRPVALKMILAGQLASDADVQRFYTEAEAAANLDHPNIVPIYEIGEHEDQHYFSMKLIEGNSLNHELETLRNDFKQAARLLASVSRAVHHAHQRGILHRDLKPGNILISADGQPHVTDFGLAKRVEGDSDLTASGAILGTPSYMAPEQAIGQKTLSTSADVYSLGAILYYLLTGCPPFQADTPMAVLIQVIDEEPEKPSRANPRIDRDLETICLKCLEKDPRRRYESAAALAEDLDRWLRCEPILARPASPLERVAKWARRRPASAALVFVGALATVLGVAGLAWQVNRERVRAATEHNLRVRAETAEQQQRSAAALAHDSEAVSRERLAQLHVRDGVNRMEQGDLPAALLFFTEALTADSDDARREQSHRRRVANVLRTMPTLCQLKSSPGVVEFSADGQYAVTNEGKTAQVWNTATAELVSPPLEHATYVLSARLTRDGKLLATTTQYDANVWSVERGERLFPVQTAEEGVFTCTTAFGRDGQLALTATGRTARLWNTATGKPIGDPMRTERIIEDATFSPSGSYVATGCANGKVRVWDTESAQPVTDPIKCEYSFRSCHFSLTEARLLVVSGYRDGGSVEVWDIPGGKAVGKPIDWQLARISFARCADNAGKYVIVDQSIWEVATGKTVNVSEWNSVYVIDAMLDAAGQRLAVADASGMARIWDVSTWKPLTPPLAHDWPVQTAKFFLDDKLLLTAAGPDVRIWDAETGRPVTPSMRHHEFVARVAVNADGMSIVVGTGTDLAAHQWQVWQWKDQDGRAAPARQDTWGKALSQHGEFAAITSGAQGKTAVEVVEVARRQVRSRWQVDPAPYAAEFDASGRFLLTQTSQLVPEADGKPAAYAEIIQVWDWSQRQPVGPPLRFLGDTSPSYVLFHPDQGQIITGSYSQPWLCWDMRTGAAAPVPPPLAVPVQTARFSGDRTRLLVWREKQVETWDPQTWRQLGRNIDLETDSFSQLLGQFSPDGKRVIVFRSNTPTVVDVESGEPVLSLPELSGQQFSYSVDFSPDGNRLVTTVRDGDRRSSSVQVRLWDCRTAAPIGTARRFPDGAQVRGFSPSGDLMVLTEGSRIHVWDVTSGTPVAPIWEHVPGPYKFAFDASGSQLVTLANNATTRIWDLHPDPRPAEDLRKLSQLLSGHRIDPTGSLVPLRLEELRSVWIELFQEYPEQFQR